MKKSKKSDILYSLEFFEMKTKFNLKKFSFGKPKIKSFVFVISILSILSVSLKTMGISEPNEVKQIHQKADEEFSKHNYKNSIDLYKKYLKSTKNESIKPQIALKILKALKGIKNWDQLFDDYEQFKKLSKNNLFQARLSTFMAGVYEDAPHYGYKRNEKIYRNSDVREGQYVYTQSDDKTKSNDFYHEAKNLYDKEKESVEINTEIIELNFDFASFLQASGNYYYPQTIKKFKTKLKKSGYIIGKTYDENIHKQIIVLYDEILELNKLIKNPNYATRSLFKKASYLASKNSWGYDWEINEEKKPSNEDPLPLLWKIVENYPESSLAPEALFSVAQIYTAQSKQIKALGIYEKLLQKYSKSTYVNDAKHYIQEIKRKELYFNPLNVITTGMTPKLNITSRNVKNIAINVYKVNMVDVVKANTNDYNKNFNELSHNFGSNLQEISSHYGKKSLSLKIKTDDKNDYKSVSKDVEIPIKKSGSYILEVVGENTVKSASLFLVTNITMVKNSDKNKSIIYVVDRETGKPVSGANVLIKENYYDYSGSSSNYYQTQSKQGKTDEKGLYVYKKRDKASSNSSTYFNALAWKGDDVTVSDVQYFYDYYNQHKYYKGYFYTDRPVYRPEQKVNFKQIVRLYENGENKNLVNEKIKIVINTPKGTPIYEKVLTTNEFGTISDFFELPKKADLGVYYIYATHNDSGQNIALSSGQQFRVEEYKKPEFEVTVKSEQNQIRVGDKVKVKINTKYYFGSPVVDAKVHYKVLKNNFYYYYYKPSRYDWLYGEYYNNKIYENQYNSYGAVFKEGDLTTDEQGNAYIEFDSEKTTLDLKYDILVDVVDKSRREIKGAGSVKVTNTLFYAFVNFDNGFYAKGEKVNAEINLKNPDGEPIEASGELKVYKVTYTGKNNEKEEKELIETEKLTSDKEGRAFYKFYPAKEGYYKLVFETRDKNESIVKGENNIWIAGDEFDGRKFKFKDVEILTDKRTYDQGDTARLMINTNYPDSYVMLFTETDNAVLSNKLIHIPSKSYLYSFKVGKEHAPNFNIRAVVVKNSQLFNDQKEIFVPYSNQFINLELKTKKDIYAPNEKASIEVKATDKDGKPVRSEVSLGIVDTSVYYIQADNSGDIRKYYYGDRRALQNQLNSSLSAYLYSITETSEKSESYQIHNNPLYYGGNGSDEESGLALGSAENKTFAKKSMALPATSMMKDKNEMDAPAPMAESGKKDGARQKAKENNSVSQEEIRSYFPDTALWQPFVVTDKKGFAKVDFKFPDSVTKWRVISNAVNNTSKVGTSDLDLVTRKDLLIRLQAPRFFVERDEIVISGIVNNDFSSAKDVKCEIATSDELEVLEQNIQSVKVSSKGEKRIDWRVKVKKEGTATITLKALSDNDKDAVQMKFPVFVHGIDKTITQNGVIKNNETKELSIKIPEERKKGSTKLTLTFSPSVVSNLVEALPYLINYPYGCVEQTTSKFIPTVVVSKTLRTLGVNISEINEIKKKERSKEFSTTLDKKNKNLVYSNTEIDIMVEDGLKRLYTFQNADGGFGWWSGFYSDPYMSAYVINALMLAKDADYQVDANVLERGTNYLTKQLEEKNYPYNALYTAYVLSKTKKLEASKLNHFFKNRDDLNDYGRALLSIAYANIGDKQKADLICQNLRNTAVIDKDTNTASWGSRTNSGYWWYWYNDRIETNSFILEAFLKARPKDDVTPMLANWLLLNRKSNHWYSTKDTANAIFALSEYAKVNKENNPNYDISVLHNGKEIKKIHVNKDNMLTFDNTITLDDTDLAGKENKFSIVKKGTGTLYYSANAEFFTLEENIKASGNQISVKREYFKLIEKKDEKNIVSYDKQPMKEGETLKSGTLVEVKLTLKANNDYEYLIFEDMKPSGFEATELKSGYVYQNGISMNQELRDEKMVFFISSFPQGTQVLTYKLRAEIPGKFHVLPHKTYAMYAPEIKAISDEFRIGTED